MSKRRVLVAVDYDGDVVPEVMDLTADEMMKVSERSDVYFIVGISETLEKNFLRFREHPLHHLGVLTTISTHTLLFEELMSKGEDI